MTSIAYLDNVRETWANMCQEAQQIKRALLMTAPALYRDTVVVTSANDSVHSDPSLHSYGLAYDIRYKKHPDGSMRTGAIIADDQDAAAEKWAKRVRLVLGRDYQVIVEVSKSHIHIERDARWPTRNGI